MIKICISWASDPRDAPSPCHKLSHLLGPPPSSVTYFMDGPYVVNLKVDLLLPYRFLVTPFFILKSSFRFSSVSSKSRSPSKRNSSNDFTISSSRPVCNATYKYLIEKDAMQDKANSNFRLTILFPF